ncbi:MAG TPA: ABC transporter ATP-binding protein [Symbiobacteriaceae bacterium]|jgi:ATP-binding cassette, subfamily B, multidrug efflux pump|nr:ABC transporter ATP-binding protein [Symbiobacteriaceae bacterium]
MSDFRQEEELEKSYDAKLMKRLLTYAKPYWKSVLFCIFLLAVSVGLELARDTIIKSAIDTYLSPEGKTAEELAALAPEARAGLVRLAMLLVGTLVTGVLIMYGQAQLLNYTGQRIIYTIRKQVFGHLQKLHLKFFDSNPAGRLVTRVTNDTEALNEMYTSVLVNLFRDVFMIIGVAILMFRYSVKLALISLVLVPVVAYYSRHYMRKARDATREVRTRLARINAFLAEHINGMKVVQLFVREKKTYDEFKAENDGYFNSSWAQLMVFAVFRPILDFLANVAVALLLWYGGISAITGDISFGVLWIFVSLIRRFFEPLMQLAEKFNIMQSAMASSERMFKLLDTEPAIVDAPDARPIGRVTGAVEFNNVWFAYENEEWVLRDVSFKAEPGQTVAFVGHTGAGKSSIINLLSRFYDVQKGEVLIDGRNVKQLAQTDLRRNVGLVAQDVFLFTGDIKSNIRLGNEQITDEQVIAAARAVEADRFIRMLPNGYEEPVVERGATLSAGQRQLISFARALAFDPAILILDEATASIDSETEAVIQRALRTLTKGRTTFIVAHRLSTIQHADQIIVLHKGKIRERGTHAELLEKQGLYYKLWRLQFEEQSEEVAEGAPAQPVAAPGV